MTHVNGIAIETTLWEAWMTKKIGILKIIARHLKDFYPNHSKDFDLQNVIMKHPVVKDFLQ